MTGWEKLQDSLTAMQDNLSSIQDVQRQLLATVAEIGESLDTLVNKDRPASPPAADERVADSVSSRTGARGLSPLLEKDEEDEDWVGKGLPDLDSKTTTVKAFPSGAGAGSLFSNGHGTISPPKLPIFGGPNTSGDASTSKQASKVPLGNKPDSPELGVSVGAAPAGLCLCRDVPLAKNPSMGTAQQRLFLVLRVVLHAVVVISEVLRLSTKSRCSRCCRHISVRRLAEDGCASSLHGQ